MKDLDQKLQSLIESYKKSLIRYKSMTQGFSSEVETQVHESTQSHLESVIEDLESLFKDLNQCVKSVEE